MADEKNLENAHTYEIEFEYDDELRMSPVFLREFKFLQTVKKEQKKSKDLSAPPQTTPLLR